MYPEVTSAMPVKYQNGHYQNGHHDGSAMLFGVGAEMTQVLEVELRMGDYLQPEEAAQMVRKAVISESFAHKLFGRTEVSGTAFICRSADKNSSFQILGVIADQTQLLSGIAGGAILTIIYLPYALLADAEQSADQVLLACAGDTEALKIRLNTLVRGAVGLKSTIGVQNLTGYLDMIDALSQKAVWVFLMVASVSMVVALGAVSGGMLSAAHEMREEIGIYRAIGSRQSDIFCCFFCKRHLLVSGRRLGCCTSALSGSLLCYRLCDTSQLG